MLENKNMNSFHSERLRHFPNVNSLMKISLGLIFFTLLSTALVYAETISVDVNGISHNVDYSVQGMTVTGIESDIESISLIFLVDVIDSSGILNVEFERSFFDSIYNGSDDVFFILADGDETVSEEIQTTPQIRSLTIKVPLGTEELEIIGSVFSDPELQPITTEPITTEPITTEPITTEPITTEPITTEPITTEPITTEPITTNENNNDCGPGTILENNVCVLDQRCGPGTILENNVCVLDSVSTLSSQSSGTSKELIMSFTVAFVIAGIVGIIFALIGKANKNKN